jgi:hypothetical protein
VVAAQAVLANLVGARVEIRDKNAGVVAPLAADNFASCHRICPAKAGAASQFPIDPTRLQVGMV